MSDRARRRVKLGRLAGALAALTLVAGCQSGAPTATPTPTLPGPTTAGSSTPHASTPSDPAVVHMYAHPPINPEKSPPADYVSALQERSAWADGLFLYYPASLPLGARPEIDALQAAYPNGVPLTISAKNASADGIRAFVEQLTPQQAAVTLWERWQEPADDFTTAADRARFRAEVEQDIALLRPAGIRVGVHEQCWTIDPANDAPWAGTEALRELIPPDVDIVTATCVDHAQSDAGLEDMRRFLTFMHRNYRGVEVGFTSLAWSVASGTPADSPQRVARAAAVQDVLDFAVRHGVTELGWFDHGDWNGFDYDVASDPLLAEVMTNFHDRYMTR
jgi:hypothetical protein